MAVYKSFLFSLSPSSCTTHFYSQEEEEDPKSARDMCLCVCIHEGQRGGGYIFCEVAALPMCVPPKVLGDEL
jgi:hypothetical protein